jgi:hypothetical protein
LKLARAADLEIIALDWIVIAAKTGLQGNRRSAALVTECISIQTD